MDLKNTKTVWISTPYRYLDADLHSLTARGNEYDERKRTERESPQPRLKEGYLDLDRGRGGSGVQVWEGRLSSGTRVGLVSASSPAAAVICWWTQIFGCSCLCTRNGWRILMFNSHFASFLTFDIEFTCLLKYNSRHANCFDI